ncbi:hypothetical protein C8046_03480 [Serinibacter arcticus]|uniref:Surface-anchored protein n=1 Tax=Serinibacter arcticus TaxID=1655435 RepID=A0A2U1ZSG7_9MICO|nr:choice-of-anchor M domain-containing protein [Serinibacter arcticus]PWD49883.1 hypothetical protein C8046_03480 [Serinibacter arcticus]
MPGAAAAAFTSTSTDPLEQTVAPDEPTGQGKVVIDAGHVDMGPRVLDGVWTLQLRDDTTAPSVWRSLEDVVLDVPDTSILPAPEDAQFDFIDVEPGSDVWVIPQTQNTAVVWAGWNSQHPSAVAVMGGGMTLRLHGVQGPGQFSLFLQNGNFDPAQLLWSSDTTEPQDVFAQANSHVHGNWVFTEPGVYLLDVEVFADLADGTRASDRQTMRIAVGDDTDPQDAFAAEVVTGTTEPTATDPSATSEQSADPPTAGNDETAAGAPSASDSQGGAALSVPALIAGGAVLLIGAAVVLTMARARRARRAAEAEAEAGDHRG